MSIIFGISDELTYLLLAIVVFVVVVVAWMTTDIQQGVYFRTVYLLDNSRVQQTRARLTNHTESATISEGTPPEDVSSDLYADISPELDEDDAAATEIIHVMDAVDGEDTLRRRRLDHFEGRASNEPSAPPEHECEHMNDANTSSSITIKLKYLNDDLKIVDGRLEEKLGDFKRRHFHVELETNHLVRLIFNGQLLQTDAHTLESYGMFDNCVVHCLVQQPRTLPNAAASNLGERNSRVQNATQTPTHRDWDLGNVFVVLLSFVLGSAWYFRFQYPHLFTISTTIGLIALSGLFSAISLSMYVSNFWRRVQLDAVHGIRDHAT